MGCLHAKLVLLLGLVGYYCYRYLVDFKLDRDLRSHIFYRWFNEIRVLFFSINCNIFPVVKPF